MLITGRETAAGVGKLRAELLDREMFYTLLEVQVLTKQYRQTYNRIRPQCSLGYPVTRAGSHVDRRTCSDAGRTN